MINTTKHLIIMKYYLCFLIRALTNSQYSEDLSTFQKESRLIGN